MESGAEGMTTLTKLLPPVRESQIARDIKEFLELHGYLAIRCVAGAVRVRQEQEHAEKANPPGFPDWCYLPPFNESGIFIEIKRPGKRPSVLQQAWLDRLFNDGFTALWFDDFSGAYGGKKPFLDWWNA
jgi:hypothetical protein